VKSATTEQMPSWLPSFMSVSNRVSGGKTITLVGSLFIINLRDVLYIYIKYSGIRFKASTSILVSLLASLIRPRRNAEKKIADLHIG
jgi:hypothetical protein